MCPHYNKHSNRRAQRWLIHSICLTGLLSAYGCSLPFVRQNKALKRTFLTAVIDPEYNRLEEKSDQGGKGGLKRGNLCEMRVDNAPAISDAWTAALETLANGKDVIQSQNRDTSTIETKWIDNSESRQFLDLFTGEDFFLRSRYKLHLQMQEGLMSVERSAGNECRAPAILVKVLKQSQKETTFLSGFQDEESDLLEESVILYRIGRMIALRQYQREREEEDSSIRNDLETVY